MICLQSLIHGAAGVYDASRNKPSVHLIVDVFRLAVIAAHCNVRSDCYSMVHPGRRTSCNIRLAQLAFEREFIYIQLYHQ